MPDPASSPRTAVVWDVLSTLSDDLDVVDVGGGTGGMAVPLARAGHRVTVVDPSPDALASLARRAADAGVLIEALQGELDDLPQLVGPVDLVLCHSVLEVVHDPAAALATLAGALRPGGHLSLLVANRNAAVLARALAGHPAEASHVLSDPRGRWGPADGTSRRFTPEQLLELLHEASLQLEQLHGVRAVSDLVPSALLEGEPAAVLALERSLSDTPPFSLLATQLHLLARVAP